MAGSSCLLGALPLGCLLGFFLGTWEFYCAKGSYFSKAHDEMYHLSGKYLNISIMHNVLGDISCILHACFGRHFGHLSKQSMKHRGTILVPARDTRRTWQSPGEQCPGQHLLLALGAALQRCMRALGEMDSGHCSLTSACPGALLRQAAFLRLAGRHHFLPRLSKHP